MQGVRNEEERKRERGWRREKQTRKENEIVFQEISVITIHNV